MHYGGTYTSDQQSTYKSLKQGIIKTIIISYLGIEIHNMERLQFFQKAFDKKLLSLNSNTTSELHITGILSLKIGLSKLLLKNKILLYGDIIESLIELIEELNQREKNGMVIPRLIITTSISKINH